ncbi:hypothetical protein NEIRO03_0591 [Nematocida sp. AWRm78]|nr:hypothetical protein NEIRO02_0544 [Nematocida sp. AWRm79]KAI5182956.1 hypothetical protein NEIRO03_0591 [Nematocida sp. AWRm78]
MQEEALNAILLSRTNKKELARIKSQILIKENQLKELAVEIEKDPNSVELSLCYLFLKRETERLVRIIKIKEIERNRLLESYVHEDAAGVADKAELSGGGDIYLKKFKEITNKYYSNFPFINFMHRDVPIEYYVHVLAKKECGIIEMGGNLIETKKGSLYFIRKREVEYLLNNGSMEVVKK